MKFAVRFWMIVALVSSVFVVACNRTEEPPASSANQSSAIPSAEQPAAQPAQQEAAPEPAEPKPTRRPAPAPARAPASPTGVKAVTASETSASTRAAVANTPALPPAPKAVELPEVVSVPSGTSLTVLMIDPVGTDTSKPGDTFTASIAEPIVVNGKTVIAKGTKVQGRVETVDEPGRVKGRAALSLVLTQLINRDKVYPLSTEPFTAEAEAGKKKDALKVGGGAALGAVIGAIAGGGKGAAIGAGVGGGAGTAAVLATKGQQLRFESEAKVTFVLEKGVDIVMSKSTS
jgi:hypothetical protein